MAMAIDPVCGMRIDTEDAAATVEHDGITYYFCSQACRDAFVADPPSYATEPAARGTTMALDPSSARDV